jgi:HK97 family phage portal protein
MGILNTIKAHRQARRLARARDEPGSVSTRDVRSVWKTRADRTMTNSEAIYAAVSRIANTIASLPIHLYRDREVMKDHPLEYLIAYRPSPCMTAFTFRQTMEANRNNEGNAYALMVPDLDGRTVRLDVIDPIRVQPYRDMDTREMWYRVAFDDGKVGWVHHSSMIVLKHMSANGERGIRPIDVLRGTLDYDADMKHFSVKQLEGVSNAVVLNVPSTALSEGKKKALIKQFLDTYAESGGKVIVLEGGITATTMEQKPVDANVLNVERVTRNRVATVYNIPPHMLGDYSDTSYATAEQSMLEYLQMTINPIIEQWEEELNGKLLTWDMIKQGYSFRFDLVNLWRTDTQTMANRNQMAIRSGWLKPNEVRRQDHLPDDPAGDTLLISRDLVPLSEAIKGTIETKRE